MGKKTHEQFLKDMEERGNPDVIILGNYINWKTPLECGCKNHPGFVWKARPNNLLQGKGCPLCGREKSKGPKKTHEEFLKQMEKTGNPNVIILEEYKRKQKKIKCQCKINSEHIWYATPADLQKGRGCPFCKNIKIGKQFSINEEEFLRRFNEFGNPDELEIIGRYEGSYKEIEVRCKKDARHIFKTKAYMLIQGCHCPYCTGHRVHEANCLNTLRPDLIKYLKNKKDGEKVTLHSEVVLDLKCPICGYEKKTTAKEFNRYGFTCPICSDGVSFPNKFIRNMLIMLGVDFIPEWSPEWVGKKRYDVMFIHDGQTIIVEMDGAFHTKESQYNTLEQNQKTDKEKERLALENNCKLIRIDCTESNAQNIFKNILKSELSEILNLKDFDWKECGIKSSKSLLVEVCKYYNEHPEKTSKELSSIFKISRDTVLTYLRKGKELGICTVQVSNRKKIKIIDIVDNKEKNI